MTISAPQIGSADMMLSVRKKRRIPPGGPTRGGPGERHPNQPASPGQQELVNKMTGAPQQTFRILLIEVEVRRHLVTKPCRLAFRVTPCLPRCQCDRLLKRDFAAQMPQ